MNFYHPLRRVFYFGRGGDVEVGKLTRKQQLFVHEYVVDFNATQAAIRAGYSAKRASEIGYQLLQKTTVREAVEEAWRDKIRRADITADDVLRLIIRAAYADIRDFVTWDDDGHDIRVRPSAEIDGELVTEVSEEVTEIGEMVKRTRKVKLVNKEAMIRLLAQHFGLTEHKLNLNVTASLSDVLTKAWEMMGEESHDGVDSS
jgi:phage terminase small subunit